MRTETFKGSLASAFGTELPTPLKFNGSYQAFGPDKDPDTYTEEDWTSAYEEVSEAGKIPSKEDVVKFVNNRALATARQKAMQSAMDAAGIKKPEVNDTPDGLLVGARNTYKQLLAAKKSEADARRMAAAAWGVNEDDIPVK